MMGTEDARTCTDLRQNKFWIFVASNWLFYTTFPGPLKLSRRNNRLSFPWYIKRTRPTLGYRYFGTRYNFFPQESSGLLLGLLDPRR